MRDLAESCFQESFSFWSWRYKRLEEVNLKNEANSCKKNNENDNEDSKVGLDEDVKAKVMKMVIMEIERCSLFAIMVLHGKRESGSESDNEDQEV